MVWCVLSLYLLPLSSHWACKAMHAKCLWTPYAGMEQALSNKMSGFLFCFCICKSKALYCKELTKKLSQKLHLSLPIDTQMLTHASGKNLSLWLPITTPGAAAIRGIRASHTVRICVFSAIHM